MQGVRARLRECVCGRERAARRDERLREAEREPLLVCAALLPGWEVFSIERSWSAATLRSAAGPSDCKTLSKKQEETHMKDT